jgi:hypothetical protein
VSVCSFHKFESSFFWTWSLYKFCGSFLGKRNQNYENKIWYGNGYLIRALPRALEGAGASDGPWSRSFICFSVNPRLRMKLKSHEMNTTGRKMKSVKMELRTSGMEWMKVKMISEISRNGEQRRRWVKVVLLFLMLCTRRSYFHVDIVWLRL